MSVLDRFRLDGKKALITGAGAGLGRAMAIALAERPAAPLNPVPLPRLAVYSSWGSTQDVGWVRYGLDQSETAYDLIYKEQVRQGNLRSRYDVVVIPHQGQGGLEDVLRHVPADQAGVFLVKTVIVQVLDQVFRRLPNPFRHGLKAKLPQKVLLKGFRPGDGSFQEHAL